LSIIRNKIEKVRIIIKIFRRHDDGTNQQFEI
jgi:hypothetical protein